jgi:hypothetical protein
MQVGKSRVTSTEPIIFRQRTRRGMRLDESPLPIDLLEHRSGDTLSFDHAAVCLDRDAVAVAFRREREREIHPPVQLVVPENEFLELAQFGADVVLQVMVESAFNAAGLVNLRVGAKEVLGLGGV